MQAIFAAPLEDAALGKIAIDDMDLDDAIETAVFVAIAEIERHERKQFDDMVLRIDRAIDDRRVVAVRRRDDLREQLVAARLRRDAVAGSDARGRAERAALEIERELDAAEQSIERLRDRDDADWTVWMQQAHGRRYAAPRIERILDVEFAAP